MLEFTISSPPVTGFKHAIPAAAQRCPLPPRGCWKGPNPAFLFYSIQGGTSLSLHYPLRGHFGTHQVRTPVFTHLWFDMNISLVCGERCVFSYKTHLDRGVSVSPPVHLHQPCLRHVPFSLLDCACRKSLSSSTRGGDCFSYPTLIANFSAQQPKPALT